LQRMDRAAAMVHRHPHWPLDALQRQRDVLVLSCAGSVGVKLSTKPFHQQVERDRPDERQPGPPVRSEEHPSELQSLMRISYAVFCLKNKITFLFFSLFYF